MNEGQSDFESCAVCGRTILRGESVSEYVTGDGERAAVCVLCKDRAEAAGWLPAELAGRVLGEPRRRGRPGLQIGERLAAVRKQVAPLAERARRAMFPPRPQPSAETRAPVERSEAPPPRPAPPKDPTRAAIEVFNGSHERRKIAGLIRSLGQPLVSVRAGARPRGAALITVAWELSWYQWEVGVAAEENGVRQVAKGTNMSEIPNPEPRWNASAREDGALALDKADRA